MSAMIAIRSLITRRSVVGAALATSGPVLAVVALLTAGMPAAPAAGAAPGQVQPGNAIFSAISCRGTFCMAVGHYTDRSHTRHALAETWNGTRWRLVRNPPAHELTSVTCSAAWFCLAQGGPTGLLRWNGSTWRELPRPPRGVGAISCGSRSECMAVNFRVNGGVVESWNGRTWKLFKAATDVCSGLPPGPCGLAGVSCGSGSDCVAVGTQTVSQEPVQDVVGLFWNGARWARTSPPGPGNPAALTGVSCAGAFCMAVGGAFNEPMDGSVAVAGTWNATAKSWQDVSPLTGVVCKGFVACGWDAISCGGPRNCMAFGGAIGLLAWDGSTWSPAPAIAGQALHLNPVACGTSFCMAVGSRTVGSVRHTLAELWNGTTWRIVPTPSPA